MSPRPREEVPEGFIKLIRSAMKKEDMSLRSVASEAEIDSATLARILTGQQGVPHNDVILRLARALNIKPPERLLYEAGRASRQLVPLLRATGQLTAAERKEVLELARRLVKKREGKR